jgi:hypothetical protein
MSETNGHGESRLDRIEEILERVEASHVKLMTDHELFVKAQDKAWRRHRRFVMEQDARWKEYDLRREQDRERERERGAELDKRIAALASGMGEFISRVTDALERK